MEKAIALVAILAIVALEICAMEKGLDGTSLSISVAAISGLGGYTAKKIIDDVKNKAKASHEPK